MSAQLISLTEQLPYLIRAIHALGQRGDYADDAEELAQDLSGITAMVAKKFTNDRTAEGILEAMRLTIGCVSLGLAHAHRHDDEQAALDMLIEHGAERLFQQGFRLIKELSELPEVAMINAYEQSPQEQERRLRATFTRYCEADANDYWAGQKAFQRELENRQKNLTTLNCAKWLRKHHHNGAIREADMDADGVIAIALIFAVPSGGKVIAKAGQKTLEHLLAEMRSNPPDFEQSRQDFLHKLPQSFHPLLSERIEHLRTSRLVTMLEAAINSNTKPSKENLEKLFHELQNHGGNEIEVDYA